MASTFFSKKGAQRGLKSLLISGNRAENLGSIALLLLAYQTLNIYDFIMFPLIFGLNLIGNYEPNLNSAHRTHWRTFMTSFCRASGWVSMKKTALTILNLDDCSKWPIVVFLAFTFIINGISYYDSPSLRRDLISAKSDIKDDDSNSNRSSSASSTPLLGSGDSQV